MSKHLQELAAQALLGLGRQAPRWPSLPGEAGQLLTELAVPGASAEQGFLRLAGVMQLCAHAGYQAPALAQAPLPPAPAEYRAYASAPTLLSLLDQVLGEAPLRLQGLLLRRLARHELLLPPALLVQALELGRSQSRLRPALRAVLGQRAAWLCAQNPDWAWAQGLAATATADFSWEEASQEQRLAWLAGPAGRQMEQARDWLRGSLDTAPARERQQLLQAFAPLAEPVDEAWLSALLQDRSKEVRLTAARLLARWPQTAYAQRMQQRLAACLQRQRKLLRESWVFEPAEAFAPDWKADAIEEAKPQYESLGPRAWWAQQLVSLTPLSWWTDYMGLSPTQLLDWAAGTDWAQPLLWGWWQALEAQGGADWAEAWLAFKPPKKVAIQPHVLLAMLPPARREAHWLRFLKDNRAPGSELTQLLSGLPEDQLLQDARLADSILNTLTRLPDRDYSLPYVLTELACVLPAASLGAVCDPGLHETLARLSSKDSAARFALIVEQRLTLDSLLPEEMP